MTHKWVGQHRARGGAAHLWAWIMPELGWSDLTGGMLNLAPLPPIDCPPTKVFPGGYMQVRDLHSCESMGLLVVRVALSAALRCLSPMFDCQRL